MHKPLFSTIAASCAALMLVGLASAGTVRPADSDEDDLRPSGKGWGERLEKGKDDKGDKDNNAAGKTKRTGSGINYHGGPLILGPTHMYYIWYGDWSGNTATTILSDLANNIGGSPYFNINTTYFDSNNTKVTNAVTLLGSTNVSSSGAYGKSLTDSEIQAVVSDAITSNHLPKDTNAVYFVLTSADVTASSGFCTQYCGWHTHATIGGSDIKYSFVGNPDRCPDACAAQSISPNGNAGADGMASIIAHELEEAVTDPDLNAWYDTRGNENADKCAWTFGTTYPVNGALANMKIGARDYLIQRNWVNTGSGSCQTHYP